MPLKGFDREDRWRDFILENTSLPLHWNTIKEISTYLGDRFQGASFDFWQKNSGGIFEGNTEENWLIFIDLKLSLRDIKWFFLKKIDLKDRFDQKSIYVTIYPIWVLEEDTGLVSEKKRDT
jgi:hypothetical protein